MPLPLRGVEDFLESGGIVRPSAAFQLTPTDRQFLSPEWLSASAKNISFRPALGELKGSGLTGSRRQELAGLLQRYFEWSVSLLGEILPSYAEHLEPGFASFRPASIAGRATSLRQDDTRLHVDAFPSRPLQGRRILRVFSNANPAVPRVWRVGEPFEAVARRFARYIRPQIPGTAWVMNRVGIVKGLRTGYDHAMLTIHDAMKRDDDYQRDVPQQSVSFGPAATWLCFTDSVSHAAMSGQFAFEQTFYLPVEPMSRPELSPLRILERVAERMLVDDVVRPRQCYPLRSRRSL